MNQTSEIDRAELRATYDALRPCYEQALSHIYAIVRELLEAHNYSPTIKYRVKRFDAYCDKLSKNNHKADGEVQPLTDIIGLRIISPFMEDVDRIEALLSERLDVVEVVRKGTEHSFREFGYDSVHLVIKLEAGLLEETIPGSSAVCEIQLRTILQDAWAEVEHELIYKSDIDLPNLSIRRKLASLNASLALSDLIFQEIRDYQKSLRLKGQQRRKSVEPSMDFSAEVSISHQSVSDNLAGSVQPFEEIPPLGGTHLERTMLRALSAHSNNDFEGAIECYNAILRMKLEEGVRSLVYNHRGMARFSLADYRKALHDFNRAVELDSQNFRAYCNRALVYRMTGELDRSMADYDMAISIEASHAESYWGRAQTCFEMKLFTQVIDDCRKALSLKEDFSPAEELIKVVHKKIF